MLLERRLYAGGESSDKHTAFESVPLLRYNTCRETATYVVVSG
jgi:hypothetical protein